MKRSLVTIKIDQNMVGVELKYNKWACQIIAFIAIYYYRQISVFL